MVISLYQYILSLRVDCTVYAPHRIYIILNCILKMDIGVLKNKGVYFLASFARKTDEIDHPWCPFLIVIYQALHALIFQSLRLHSTLQCVNSVVRLARNKGYSKYRGFKVLQINILSVVNLPTYSEVYLGPYDSCVINNSSKRQSDLYTLSILHLSVQPFSGLVERRIILLYFYPSSGASGLCPIEFLQFYKVYSKNLRYFLALAFQACTIWKISRGLLLGVPLKSLVQASCLRFTARISWWSPLLPPNLLLFPLVWKSSFGIFLSLVTCLLKGL